jgi:hypothetical protein
MHSTRGRCYSVAEMEGFLRGCGFVEIHHAETTVDRSVLMARKPT